MRFPSLQRFPRSAVVQLTQLGSSSLYPAVHSNRPTRCRTYRVELGIQKARDRDEIGANLGLTPVAGHTEPLLCDGLE